MKERKTLGLFTYRPEEKGEGKRGGERDEWVLSQQQQTISQFDQWKTKSGEERDSGRNRWNKKEVEEYEEGWKIASKSKSSRSVLAFITDIQDTAC